MWGGYTHTHTWGIFCLCPNFRWTGDVRAPLSFLFFFSIFLDVVVFFSTMISALAQNGNKKRKVIRMFLWLSVLKRKANKTSKVEKWQIKMKNEWWRSEWLFIHDNVQRIKGGEIGHRFSSLFTFLLGLLLLLL